MPDDFLKIFRCLCREIDKFFYEITTKFEFAHSTPTTSQWHGLYSRARFANLLRNAESWNDFLPSFKCLILLRFEIIKHKCDAVSFNTLDCVFDIIRICLRIFFSMLQYLYPLQGFLLRLYDKEAACNTNDSKTVTIGKFCNKLRRNCVAILN